MAKFSLSPVVGKNTAFDSAYFELRAEGGFSILGDSRATHLSLNLQYNHRRYAELTSHSLGLGVSLNSNPISMGPYIRYGTGRKGNYAGDYVEAGLNIELGFLFDFVYLDFLSLSISRTLGSNSDLFPQGNTFVGIGSDIPTMVGFVFKFGIPGMME